MTTQELEMAKDLHGWKVTQGEGVVTFRKGEHSVETTYNPDSDTPEIAERAYDHALAQAYVIDNPSHKLSEQPDVMKQWAEIWRWAREGTD